MTSSDTPQRGEVWMVNFDPTIGTEIRKIRPAVVIIAIVTVIEAEI
jgi:mRNA interferase MazF